MSFDEARGRFLADSETRNKPRTLFEYRRLLNRHFHFTKKLIEVTRADIMKSVENLKGKPAEQKHAFVAIRTMMNWCHRYGLINESPLPPLSFTANARSRVLTDEELRSVWHCAARHGYAYGSIVQLLILTGQRRGEIAAMRRFWIDGNTIVFPTGFTKNKREHRLPLGPTTQAIIGAIQSETDLLFPSRLSDESPFNGWSKSKAVLDKRLGFADYTLHDLRRTFSSQMAAFGTPIHVTEKLLNHLSGTLSGVAGVYNRYSYAAEMRSAIEAYEMHLQNLVGAS